MLKISERTTTKECIKYNNQHATMNCYEEKREIAKLLQEGLSGGGIIVETHTKIFFVFFTIENTPLSHSSPPLSSNVSLLSTSNTIASFSLSCVVSLIVAFTVCDVLLGEEAQIR